MDNCAICKFVKTTPYEEPCISCVNGDEEKPRGTHWEFSHGDYESVHPCMVCARSGDRSPISCYFPEYEGIFKGQTCCRENQYYKFLLIEEPEEELKGAVDGALSIKKDMIDEGTAATSPHYNSLPVQPIELMEAMLTHEEFLGFLKGSMIKYAMRAGRKGETQKDVNKYEQYKEFHEYVVQPGHSISDLVK